MLNGYQKEKDTESQERLIIMRNIMWAAMVVYQKRNFKPTDIISFGFEEKVLKKMSDADYDQFLKEIEEVKAFYAKQDNKN